MSVALAVDDNGTIIQWDGDQTRDLLSSPTTANLYSVSMASDSDAWAVGGGTEGNGVIIRWDGSDWTVWEGITLGEDDGAATIPTLYSVNMLDNYFGWAVGAGGTVLVWEVMNGLTLKILLLVFCDP